MMQVARDPLEHRAGRGRHLHQARGLTHHPDLPEAKPQKLPLGGLHRRTLHQRVGPNREPIAHRVHVRGRRLDDVRGRSPYPEHQRHRRGGCETRRHTGHEYPSARSPRPALSLFESLLETADDPTLHPRAPHIVERGRCLSETLHELVYRAHLDLTGVALTHGGSLAPPARRRVSCGRP